LRGQQWVKTAERNYRFATGSSCSISNRALEAVVSEWSSIGECSFSGGAALCYVSDAAFDSAFVDVFRVEIIPIASAVLLAASF
jgi:hypothetical protein